MMPFYEQYEGDPEGAIDYFDNTNISYELPPLEG